MWRHTSRLLGPPRASARPKRGMRLHSFEGFRVVGPCVVSTCAKTFLDVRPWCSRRWAVAYARCRRRRAAVTRRRCTDRRIGARLSRVSYSLHRDRRTPASGSVDADRWRTRGDSTRHCTGSSTPLMRASTCCSQRSPLRLRCSGQAPGPSMRAFSAGGASKSAMAMHTERGTSHAPNEGVARAFQRTPPTLRWPFRTPIEPKIHTNRGSRASVSRRNSADKSNARRGGFK